MARPDGRVHFPSEGHFLWRGGGCATIEGHVAAFESDLRFRLLDDVGFGEVVAGVVFIGHPLDHLTFQCFRMSASGFLAPDHSRGVEPFGEPLEVAVAEDAGRVQRDFPGVWQVWSLTQFHFAGFLQSRMYEKCVFKAHDKGLCYVTWDLRA